MRAGKLDRIITLQDAVTTIDEKGTPIETWGCFATVPAELVQGRDVEQLRDYGENAALSMVFRIRWLPGLTTAHRAQYEGRNLNIREIVEIGRRRGLELRCEEVRT